MFLSFSFCKVPAREYPPFWFLETKDGSLVGSHVSILHTPFEIADKSNAKKLTVKNGGIIFTQFKIKSEVENFIKNDPYAINDLTHYEIIEFTPGHFHPDFPAFLK